MEAATFPVARIGPTGAANHMSHQVLAAISPVRRQQITAPDGNGATPGNRDKRPGIVAILPRGETIRNFAHTGALDAVNREAQLTVLSVVPSQSVFASLATRYRSVLPLEQTAERYPVRIVRDLLDMAHGRHLWSHAARVRWGLRDAEANTPMRWLKRWGKKLACYPFATARGLAVLEESERILSRVCRATDSYDVLFRTLRPSLVFNGSHVHSAVAMQAVHAARWLGIPTAAFIFSWDNLTSQGRVVPAYDYYLVWNEDLKKQLLRVYPRIRSEQVVVTGTPQFDFHFREGSCWSRDEFCRRVGADPTRPIVLYTTGMAEHMPGEPAVVEGIADMLRDLGVGRPAQLLVRVYPKDRTGRFDELKNRRSDILFPEARWEEAWLTPTEEDTQLFTNTVRHADVGINVASTVSLELCMFDKPVINVAYNPRGLAAVRVDYARYYEFDHYRPLVESGAVHVVHSEAEMPPALRAALEQPERGRESRRALIEQMFGNTLDGRSGERVARILLRLANDSDSTSVVGDVRARFSMRRHLLAEVKSSQLE
jgi:hypothetical protein